MDATVGQPHHRTVLGAEEHQRLVAHRSREQLLSETRERKREERLASGEPEEPLEAA